LSSALEGSWFMSTVLAPPEAAIETVAEMLQKLGEIGPERILVRPPMGTATEADVLAALAAPRKRICELIDGVLVEKPAGYRESVLAAFLAYQLGTFVYPRKSGLISGEAGTLRMWPGRVRIPDLAFIAWNRLPGGRIPDEPIPTLAPDPAIEVLSPSNTAAEMLLKREDYFSVGVRLVWEIDPRSRTAAVFTSPQTPLAVLTEADSLDGSPVLPGFTLALKDLFAQLNPHS
jgi:Uma2 family endonuclease